MPETTLIPVSVIALVEDQINSSPIVLLHDQQLNRLLPIWIGDFEARAVAIILNKTPMPRPLTHKLVLNTLQNMGGKLLHIVIDRLKNNTYFASMHVVKDGHNIAIDARPSDAIAIALEAKTPIFVTKEIMDSAAQKNPLPDIGKQERKPSQAKRDFKETDLKKLKELLEKARQREQSS